MEFNDAICILKTRTDLGVTFLTSQNCCAHECCTPVPALVWETNRGNLLKSANQDGAFTPRAAVALPGAWAMGEGLLMEVDDPFVRGTPPRPAGSAAMQAGLSCMAGSLTSTMGSYLTGLANAISSCSRSVTMDDGHECPCPSPADNPAGGGGASSSSSPCGRRPRPAPPPGKQQMQQPTATPCAVRDCKKDD